MRIAPERRNVGGEDLSLIFELVALEYTADDLDAFAHYRGRADFLAFALADFFHEDLRRAEAEKKAVAGEILHYTRLHRNLHRVTGVRRNDSPAELNALGLAGDYGKNRGGGACFERMFAPPGIGFRDPEGVEARVLARLGHGRGFVDGLHAELKDSEVEWNCHIFRSQV